MGFEQEGKMACSKFVFQKEATRFEEIDEAC